MRSTYLSWAITGPYKRPSLASRVMQRLGWWLAGVS